MKSSFKKIICILLVLISVILNIFLVFKILEKDRLTLYSTDIISENLSVKNITLISFNDILYVQNGFKFELLDSNDKIESLSLEISMNDNNIFDLSLGNHIPDKSDLTDSLYNIKSDIDINTDSIMRIKLKYTVNGKGVEFYDNIYMKTIEKYVYQ